MPRVGLVTACEDAQLLGARLQPRQRELAEAIEASTLVVAACGRRFGKTRTAAAAALHNLLLTPELDELVGFGERRYAVSVANSQAQARIFVEQAHAIAKASPTLRGQIVQARAFEIEFKGGRVLAAFPCTAKGSRGWPISFLLLDEFAHHFDLDEGGPMVASRVYAALSPSVAQFGALGRTVIASTPLGSDGMFAELFAKAQGGEIPGAVAFHAPTSDNPLIAADYLAAQEAALGFDDFRREFGAEFIAGGASFFEESRLRDVVADDESEFLAGDGTGWVLALDPAFASDPTGAVVVGRDASDPESLLVAYANRWLPPKRRKGKLRTREETDRIMFAVLDDVAAVAQRFQARVVTDAHLPGTVVTELGKRGVHASVRPWNGPAKTAAFQALRARVYSRRIVLPRHPQLIAELARVRTKLPRGRGAALVETPRVGDSHCDIANALALGVSEFDHGGNPSTALAILERQLEAMETGANRGLAADIDSAFGGDGTRSRKWYDGREGLASKSF
jgi:hypothetical protein